MNWNDIEAAWHDLTDQILSHWPELDAGHLLSAAGDKGRFAEYLAATYDLTVNEAVDCIEMWLFRLGRAV